MPQFAGFLNPCMLSKLYSRCVKFMAFLPFDCCCANPQVASLVAVLKVARQLNLVRDLDRVTVPGHDPVHIPEALLRRAIEHGNDTLLVDAMALVCSHPKSTAVPGMHHAHCLCWTHNFP